MLLRIAGLVLAGGVSLWLSLQPRGEPLTWVRVENTLGVYGVVLVGSVLLGMVTAEIGRSRHWSPRECRRCLAIPLVSVGALVGVYGLGTSLGRWLEALCCCGWVSGIVCRKLVHPELGWMDSDPPEPTLSIR